MRFDHEAAVFIVGGRRFPVRNAGIGDSDMMSGRIHRERHIYLVFENGIGMSVAWGSMTYSDNHQDYDYAPTTGFVTGPFVEEPTTVEIGFVDPVGDFMTQFDVVAYADDDKFFESVEFAQSLPSATRTDHTLTDMLAETEQWLKNKLLGP